MKDIVTYGVVFNLYYEGKSESEKNGGAKSDVRPVDETTPEFRDFTLIGITCAGAAQAIFINGLPEMPVRNVTISDCRFTAQKGVEVNYAENVTFNRVYVNGEKL